MGTRGAPGPKPKSKPRPKPLDNKQTLLAALSIVDYVEASLPGLNAMEKIAALKTAAATFENTLAGDAFVTVLTDALTPKK